MLRSFPRNGSGAPPWCRLCGESLETADHLLLECARARAVLERASIRWGIQLPPPGAQRLDFVLGGSPEELMTAVAAVVHRLAKACARSQPQPLWGAETAPAAPLGEQLLEDDPLAAAASSESSDVDGA